MNDAQPPAPSASPGDEPTRIVAVRHGRTAWNVALRMQGHLDVGLDAVGRWQAARVAQALAGEGLAAVYSSDLQRAADTAAAVAGACGLAVVHDAALRERGFGVFEGSTHAELQARWPEEARRWRERDPGFVPAGGESLIDFRARCLAAVKALAARHRGQAIAVVTHGGVLDILYRAATRVELQVPRSWALGNAAINRLLHADGGFMLVGWNDDAHLEGQGDGVVAPSDA